MSPRAWCNSILAHWTDNLATVRLESVHVITDVHAASTWSQSSV